MSCGSRGMKTSIKTRDSGPQMCQLSLSKNLESCNCRNGQFYVQGALCIMIRKSSTYDSHAMCVPMPKQSKPTISIALSLVSGETERDFNAMLAFEGERLFD